MPIRLDFSNMMAPAVAGGVAEQDWAAAAERFRAAHSAVESLRAGATLGFLDLPADRALLAQATEFAARARGRYSDVVVLGIGGSALGPIALRTALRPYGWNSLAERERDGHPRLHVLDNVDPVTIAALLGRLDLGRSLFVVTSKSGGT